MSADLEKAGNGLAGARYPDVMDSLRAAYAKTPFVQVVKPDTSARFQRSQRAGRRNILRGKDDAPEPFPGRTLSGPYG